MKKAFFKFTALIMIFALALTLAGCSLFEVNGDNTGGDSSVNSQTPAPGDSSGDNNTNTGNGNYGTVVDLPALEEIDKKVIFGTTSGERVKSDKADVCEAVKHSVVAIATASGTGSGVIVDMKLTDKSDNPLDNANDFYIITCHHVIDGAGDVVVYMPDAEYDNFGEDDYDYKYKFTGTIGGTNNSGKAVTLVGGDKKSDIAVLKLTISDNDIASRVVKAKLPPSQGYQMKMLEEVIAIGNPSGDLPGTATFGTISYINRETSVADVGALTLLQIDVDINPGSSGGALFNLYGELIGITSAGRGANLTTDGKGNITGVEDYDGLNFAIPYVVDATKGSSDYGFRNIATHLLITKTDKNYGYVSGRKSLFGFTTSQDLTANVVKIAEVTANSLAYGKLKVGDVVLKVVKGDKSGLSQAQDVTSNAQVSEVFNSLRPGDKVCLLVSRAGAGNVEVELTAQEEISIFCDTGVYA